MIHSYDIKLANKKPYSHIQNSKFLLEHDVLKGRFRGLLKIRSLSAVVITRVYGVEF